MSPSSRPTLAPNRARPTARFALTVLLPTPPLPAPTAMMCFTSGRGLPPSRVRSLALRTSAVNSISSLPSGSPISIDFARTASSISPRILSFMGQAGVVSSMMSLTSFPVCSTSLTMPRVTRSLPRSGSWTVRRASWRCFDVSAIVRQSYPGQAIGRGSAWNCCRAPTSFAEICNESATARVSQP